MKFDVTNDTPGLSDVPGFQLGSTGCDIRQNGKERLDLTVMYSERPCTGAGVFTKNDLKAAPVRVCQERLKPSKPLHGFVANSGNANAATGKKGLLDARHMASAAAKACGVPEDTFLVCSTGRIGRALPMPSILSGINIAAESLGTTPKHGKNAAQAILTSDTKPKTVTARVEVEGEAFTVAGMAKGAGMIQPDMATMLAFIATDLIVHPELLQSTLRHSTDITFNRISIDGDMSTNDTVLLFANGASGHTAIEDRATLHMFHEAVVEVSRRLAEMIVRDGERVSKCVTLEVRGCRSEGDAEKVARAIANSLLVKTSWFGNDPNWGRIAHAAGYAGVGLVEEKLDIAYNHIPVLNQGQLVNDNEPEWKRVVSKPAFCITVNLNLGGGSFSMLASDLTTGYVDFNKSE